VISSDLDERLRDLRAHGEPFVTATVVRVQRPTSAQAGNVALVRSDGSIEGFVGGVCAQHSLRLYSLKAIQSGEPLLLRIMPDGPEDADGSRAGTGEVDAGEEIAREDGAVTVQNPCLSGGAIEMFLEPFLPSPRVLVAGDSPIVEALKDLGARLGLDMIAAGAHGAAPAAGDLALVVAAHGRDEIGALRAGVEAGVPYVGLVASPRRGAAVLVELREDGVEEELVARIESPAGLNIGARTPPEIALSILTRVVEMRRARDVHTGTLADGTGSANATGSAGPQTAIDPVCGMTVVVLGDTPLVQHDGETTYFCCEGCRDRFERQRAG
jgi:xanthine dehydrogenase accessory factor